MNTVLSDIEWHSMSLHSKREIKRFLPLRRDHGQSSGVTLHGTNTVPIVDQLLW